MSDYTFIREIQKFDIDDYTPHLGWIAPKITTIKIYTQSDSLGFFLHDEVTDKLFEFSSISPELIRNNEEYEKIVMAYLLLNTHKKMT